MKKDRAEERERERREGRERGVGFWCEEVVSAIICFWFGFCGVIFELFELVNVMIVHVCLNKSFCGTCNLRDILCFKFQNRHYIVIGFAVSHV